MHSPPPNEKKSGREIDVLPISAYNEVFDASTARAAARTAIGRGVMSRFPALRPCLLLHGRRRRQRDRRALRRRSSYDLKKVNVGALKKAGSTSPCTTSLPQRSSARSCASAARRIHRPREARRRGHPVLRHLLFVPRRHVPYEGVIRSRTPSAQNSCSARGALISGSPTFRRLPPSWTWRAASRLPSSRQVMRRVCRRGAPAYVLLERRGHGKSHARSSRAPSRLRRVARCAIFIPAYGSRRNRRFSAESVSEALQGIRRDCRSAEEQQDPRHRQHGRLQQPARRLARHHRHR